MRRGPQSENVSRVYPTVRAAGTEIVNLQAVLNLPKCCEHFIMDSLLRYHSMDIQWGNHDILWMGAASGSMTLVATVLADSIHDPLQSGGAEAIAPPGVRHSGPAAAGRLL